MPTYTYRCTSCRAKGEAFRRIADRANCPRCTQCGGATEKLVDVGLGVAVFKPYRTPCFDKDTGKTMRIRNSDEHRAFLRRNDLEEIGNDKRFLPPSPEEAAHRRAEKLKEEAAAAAEPTFDFNLDTHEATLETTP